MNLKNRKVLDIVDIKTGYAVVVTVDTEQDFLKYAAAKVILRLNGNGQVNTIYYASVSDTCIIKYVETPNQSKKVV